MSIKEKMKYTFKKCILTSIIKGSNKSTPLLVYEVPKPDNYDELVKRVKKNHPELNQGV